MIKDDRSSRAILLLWIPLALQWLMMAIEGPFLAAIIARLAEPTFNLAAYGVSYAFAILVESPIIMLMSATTALLEGPESYRRLRNFMIGLNLFATALLVFVLIPPVFAALMEGVIGLPSDVANLVNGSLWLLLPWPASIGYRRFLHGVLIRAGKTRLIAYGTGLRLVAMGTVALLLSAPAIPGAWVGAAALSSGVVIEAIAARIMARGAIRQLLHEGRLAGGARSAEPVTPTESGLGAGTVRAIEQATAASTEPPPLSYAGLLRFYYPLALTSFIALSTQPLLTFFMGRAPLPVESLAVFPVVHALSFFFSALGLSFQEAAIALLGRRCEHAPALARFGWRLALVASGGLALVVFTPLAAFWFETVSGLPPQLADIALTPARVLVLIPGLAVFLSLQRAILVQSRSTKWITAATAVEVVAIAILFPLLGWRMGVIGVTAAMAAFVGGRAIGVVLLLSRTLPTIQGRSA